jgi:hypothetical protein
MPEAESSPMELIKFALVIVAILAVSTGVYLLTSTSGLTGRLRWFMAIFFLTFGSFKLAGYQMFADMFSGYDIVAERFKPYAYAYPFIELALGIAYASAKFQPWLDWVTLAVMAVGTVGVFRELKRRTGIHCACLGNIIKLPLSTVSLVEDVGMGAMALFMIFGR